MSCMKVWVKKGSSWTLKHTRCESSLTVRTETILPRRTQSRARRSRFLRNSCWAIFRCTSSKAFVSLYHHASSAWPVQQNNHLKWSQYNYCKYDSFAALMIQKKGKYLVFRSSLALNFSMQSLSSLSIRSACSRKSAGRRGELTLAWDSLHLMGSYLALGLLFVALHEI